MTSGRARQRRSNTLAAHAHSRWTTFAPIFPLALRIGDWTYRLRAEDDPPCAQFPGPGCAEQIDDTDVIFERLDRPGPVGPAIFAVQTSGLTVSLAWDAFPGATSYQLEAGMAAGLSNIFVGDIGNVTSFQATGPPVTLCACARDWPADSDSAVPRMK
jgi:hypothetical protein